ncbi:metallophosphoesterase [Cytobacillus sp. FJAT-54145]|uniref:Metallophosphoesterase n=1 Tax=Cytobacillus spartinae TaxID=3299023 RepID=A0ABW6KAC5_9BACI
MGKTYVCSDLHGQFLAFQKAIQVSGFSLEKGDHLWYLGDAIDRWGHSKACFETIYNWREQYPEQVKFHMGNHEKMLLDFLASPNELSLSMNGQLWLQNGGMQTCFSFLNEFYDQMPPTFMDLQQAFLTHYPNLIQQLRSLTLYHETDDAIFTHAGLYPHVPLEEQTMDDFLWVRDEFFEHYNGKLVVHGHTQTFTIPDYSKPIRDRYGRIEKYGTREGLHITPHRIGIDGGCASRHEFYFIEWPTLKTYVIPCERIHDWDVKEYKLQPIV